VPVSANRDRQWTREALDEQWMFILNAVAFRKSPQSGGARKTHSRRQAANPARSKGRAIFDDEFETVFSGGTL
jgi:hypothetical protein